MSHTLVVKKLGLVDYQSTWDAMRRFTQERDEHTGDELWLLEHYPVFSQGQAGKAEHIIGDTDIPIIKTDRGGQITYHGPGQLVAYVLLDLKRLKIGVRDLVSHIENATICCLDSYGIRSAARSDAPGVYVGERKIASLGLRIHKGRSFHGLALNVSADLAPFGLINPCGYPGMEMVNINDLVSPEKITATEAVAEEYARFLARELSMQIALP